MYQCAKKLLKQSYVKGYFVGAVVSKVLVNLYGNNLTCRLILVFFVV